MKWYLFYKHHWQVDNNGRILHRY